MEVKKTDILLGLDYIDRKHKTGLDRYCEEMLLQLGEVFDPLNVFSYNQTSARGTNVVEQNCNINLINLHTTRQKYLAKQLLGFSLPAIDKVVMQKNIDLVHLLIPMPFNLKLKKPVLITIHDLTPFITPQAFPKYTPFLIKRTINQLYKAGAYFTTNSYNTKRDLLKFFPIDEKKVFPIHLGLSSSFAPVTDVEKKDAVKLKYTLPDSYFLYIGAMNKRKNLTKVIDAFEEFISMSDNAVMLVLAGRMEWGGNEILEYVRSKNLTDRVHFPGYIDDSDLNVVIGSSLALLYMSLYEGFGFPVLEAMSCATAVIASNNSSIPEVAGEFGYLADPNSVESIVNSMNLLYNDTALREKKIAGGLQWAKNFSWQKTAAETVKLYEYILEDYHAKS